MLHWTQQPRVNPSQSGQGLRVQPIVFLTALSDQPHFAGIRHDHLMPQLTQQSANPRRMRPGFQGDATARHLSEDFPQCFRIGTHALLPLDLAGFVQHAIPAVAISQIESDDQCGLRNIPARPCRYGANLLHCRSPFISCASEHVDNLGAYTASRPETGLLIPSVYDS
jgi:hypothetical protein